MENQNMSKGDNMDRIYNGRIVFYHPTRKGDGAAARFEMRLNRVGEEGYDCFFLEMAQQKGVRNGNGGNASFDWGNKVTVKLGFMDICEFLTVLEGKARSVGGSRGSLYHQTEGGNTLIGLSAREGGGYSLGLSRRADGGSDSRRVSICLSEVEATGLRQVLQTGIFFLSFHSSLLFRQGSATRVESAVRNAN